MKRTMILFLIAALLLCGCGMIPPTDSLDTSAPETTDPSSAATVPTTTGPLLAKDYLGADLDAYGGDDIAHYEVIIPEGNVLILSGENSLEDVFIDGDVYITATANVSFCDVRVRGKVYCHGILTGFGYCGYTVFTYHSQSVGSQTCSAYDGLHGEFIYKGNYSSGTVVIGNNILDYAFEYWGNFGPVSEKPDLAVSQNPIEPETVQHGDTSKLYPEAFIFNGEGYVSDKEFFGDVYITSNSVIEFDDVRVFGDIYCYGQLKFSNNDTIYTEDFTKNNQALAIYAYSFQESCESFDGVHGLIVGGPITCTKIVISDDALDYAFTTFGKQ